MRYDKFMRLGWRVLIPVAIGWVVLVATLRAVRNEFTIDTRSIFMTLGVVLVVLALGIVAMDYIRGEPEKAPEPPPWDPYSGGFPVPPLPGQELVVTPRAGRLVTSSVVEHDVTAPAAAEAKEADNA